MNIIVIGLGSMGKRRIRLLQKHYKYFNLFGVDTNIDRRMNCESDFNIRTFSSIQEVIKMNKIDIAFICSSPLTHNKIITKCLKNKIHVFSELNLVNDGYKENINLAKEKGVLLFLSSTALYRKETNFIIEKVREVSGPSLYTYHIGQYLPDWHPWEDYNNFFIGDKKTNGCREILAIELPWIIKCFDEIIDIHVLSGKLTSLNINYPDYYIIQITHKNGTKGNLIVDVVCREAVRKLEVFNENLYIEWNGRPNTFRVKNIESKVLELVNLYDEIDTLEGYNNTIIENQYLDEINQFFDELKGTKKSIYNFENDQYTLEIIDKIEGIAAL